MRSPLAALCLLVACRGAPTAAPDAVATRDVVASDLVALQDLPITHDAATDRPDASDAGNAGDAFDVVDAPDVSEAPEDPCVGERVIDLDALGTRDGATVRVVGSNARAGRRATLDATCAAGMTGHVVVYRYTPRARGRLRISTNFDGTDARLDTVVFALRACAPDAGTSLGCGDDTGDPPRDHASTFVTDADVEAGVAVYIAVGGFLHATRELWDSQGTFELRVTELATR